MLSGVCSPASSVVCFVNVRRYKQAASQHRADSVHARPFREQTSSTSMRSSSVSGGSSGSCNGFSINRDSGTADCNTCSKGTASAAAAYSYFGGGLGSASAATSAASINSHSGSAYCREGAIQRNEWESWEQQWQKELRRIEVK